MADRPHLRLADHTDLANDDPFAELTKIMGFDPRQPIKPTQTNQPPALTADDGFDELDFSIDLEKELMGEFADEPEFAALPLLPEPKDIQPAQPVAYSDVALDAATPNLVRPMDDEIAFDEDWFHDQDLDGAHVPAKTSPQAESVPFSAADLDFGPDDVPADDTLGDDLLAAFPAPANDIPAVMSREPYFSANDLTDTAEPEEFGLDLPEPTRPDTGIFGRLPGAANPSTTDDVEIDRIFEGALADVDMHFDNTPAAPTVHAPEPSLDSELDLRFEAIEDTDTAGDHAYADHDVYDEDTGGQPEAYMSLEDELNALLGNALGSQRTAPVSVHALPEIPAFQSPALDIVDTDTADVPFEPAIDHDIPEVTAQAVLPATAEHGWEDESEQSWEVEAPAEETALYAEAADPSDSTDTPFDDIDLEFDEHSFDDAMAQSFSEPTVAVEQEEPVFEPAVVAQADHEVPKPASNPYAALSALSATLAPTRFASPPPVYARREPEPVFDAGNDAGHHLDEPVYVPAVTAPEPAHFAAGYVAPEESDTPDIETLDVPEQAVALADDLDLPDFAYEDEPAPAPTYDDIDAEFTSLLNDMNASDTDVPEPARGSAVAHDFSDEFDRNPAPIAAPVTETSPHAAQYAAAAVAAAAFHPASAASTAGIGRETPSRATGHGQTVGDDDLADMEFAYDPDLDEEMALPAFAAPPQRPAPRRGMMIAAVVGGVALLGGVGAFALSFGGGTGSNEPVLVKADDTPVKVKPENPGGTTIPNQDNKVYDTVAGGASAADPKQDTLVSTEEEPLEMPAPVDETEDALAADDVAASAETDSAAVPPSQKAEDRVEQVAEAPGVDNSVEVAAVAPRKVRTMVVKADGTLVAREEPSVAPSSASAGMSDPVATVGTQATGTVPLEAAPAAGAAAGGEATLPIATAPAEEAAPVIAAVEPAAPAPALAPVAKAQEQSSNTPNSVPVAPGRPSDQPVDIVGEVKPDKVAAVSSAAAAPGAWAMQIASQPTEAAAKSSYQDLSRRYASVLDGRQANIVKADIAGKGTFWRVRVAASSRNEAVSMCESYKAAGGNCFVSK